MTAQEGAGDRGMEKSFVMLVPDQKNNQLLPIHTQRTESGISVKQLEPLNLPFGPTGLAVNPEGSLLVATAVEGDATLAASIKIADSGELELIATSRLGFPSGYTSIDRRGRFFMTVHYRSGAIATYRIDSDGVIGENTFSSVTPNKEAHCILTTPDNGLVYIPCVKTNNALYQYAFDEATGKLSPLEPFDARPPAMFGPRHVAYHPSLPIAYFSNEQQLGVSVYAIGADGQLDDLQHAVSMPRRIPYEKGQRDMSASDIVLSPDGDRLYVAVRDFPGDEDSVFTFQVHSNGRLELIARSMVGNIPWKLATSPLGDYVIVSESADQCLAIFETQPNGSLKRVGSLQTSASVRDLVVLK